MCFLSIGYIQCNMTELLAEYWFNSTRVFQNSNTSYISLYDDGRSANIIVIMGGYKVQLPKWLMRDYISLSFVAYPKQRFVRRNPYHVTILDNMKKMLANTGLYYDPGGLRGTVRTNISGVLIDPDIVFDQDSRANIARIGDHNDMLRMISDDIIESGANITKRSGVEEVRKKYGWTTFEVVMAAHVQSTVTPERSL